MKKNQKDIGLKDFIESSIRDVFAAIQNLQSDSKGEKLEGIVCPSFETKKNSSAQIGGNTRMVTPIHFDLQVEATRGNDINIELPVVNVVSAHFGILKNETVKAQHISFDIDVVFPAIRTKEKIGWMPDVSVYSGE